MLHVAYFTVTPIWHTRPIVGQTTGEQMKTHTSAVKHDRSWIQTTRFNNWILHTNNTSRDSSCACYSVIWIRVEGNPLSEIRQLSNVLKLLAHLMKMNMKVISNGGCCWLTFALESLLWWCMHVHNMLLFSTSGWQIFFWRNPVFYFHKFSIVCIQIFSEATIRSGYHCNSVVFTQLTLYETFVEGTRLNIF